MLLSMFWWLVIVVAGGPGNYGAAVLEVGPFPDLPACVSAGEAVKETRRTFSGGPVGTACIQHLGVGDRKGGN